MTRLAQDVRECEQLGEGRGCWLQLILAEDDRLPKMSHFVISHNVAQLDLMNRKILDSIRVDGSCPSRRGTHCLQETESLQSLTRTAPAKKQSGKKSMT